MTSLPVTDMEANGSNQFSVTSVTKLSSGGLPDSGTLTKSMESMSL